MGSQSKGKEACVAELRAMAKGLPLKLVDLPDFHKAGYVPTAVRQPREFPPWTATPGPVARFLQERGIVDLLTPAQTRALFTEMHWAGYQITVLAQRSYRQPPAARTALMAARRHMTTLEAAEEELFIANRRLVVRCAKPFWWIGHVWIGDFLQEGSRALSHAIRRFDFTRGTPFYAYAQRAIQNRLRNFFRDHTRSGMLAVRPGNDIERLLHALAAAQQAGQAGPTDDDLAQATDLPVERVKRLRPFIKLWAHVPEPPLSLDALIGTEKDTTLHALLADPGTREEAWHAAERAEIWQAIAQLPSRDRRVMEMRFIEGRTLEEVGQELHLTRARIKQIEDESLQKARQWLKRPPAPTRP